MYDRQLIVERNGCEVQIKSHFQFKCLYYLFADAEKPKNFTHNLSILECR